MVVSVGNVGDPGSIPGLGRSPGEGNRNPLQYSCLESFMDGGAWKATVHGITRNQKGVSNITSTFHFPLSCIGKENGNPLKFSCLENPWDGGAWWAAVYGVAQSQTRLSDWTELFIIYCNLFPLLLLLSHFSRVQLCVTPQTAAHQAPPSQGFSRQEHWSGLPFPSPMHESKKWK